MCLCLWEKTLLTLRKKPVHINSISSNTILNILQKPVGTARIVSLGKTGSPVVIGQVEFNAELKKKVCKLISYEVTGPACWVLNCSSNSKQIPKPDFFPVPNYSTSLSKRKLWTKALPGKRGVPHGKWICGKHFVSGRPNPNPSDIDYVPTIFQSNITQEETTTGNESRVETEVDNHKEPMKVNALEKSRTKPNRFLQKDIFPTGCLQPPETTYKNVKIIPVMPQKRRIDKPVVTCIPQSSLKVTLKETPEISEMNTITKIQNLKEGESKPPKIYVIHSEATLSNPKRSIKVNPVQKAITKPAESLITILPPSEVRSKEKSAENQNHQPN